MGRWNNSIGGPLRGHKAALRSSPSVPVFAVHTTGVDYPTKASAKGGRDEVVTSTASRPPLIRAGLGLRSMARSLVMAVDCVDGPQGCALCLLGVFRRGVPACMDIRTGVGSRIPQRKHRRRVAGTNWTPFRVPATASLFRCAPGQ